MTNNIKNNLDQVRAIINKLIAKVDLANLGGWATEKAEIEAKIAYLTDKTQTKPTDSSEIQMDLGEIENLEATLQALTKDKTDLTTEKTNLETRITELEQTITDKDQIINSTTIPNLITQLEQYASKVTNPEVKTLLAEIQTALGALRNTDLGDTNSRIEELKSELAKVQKEGGTD